jgi:alkanesulfonate monooxygenase SsuD/methylene tetrahydromethanopterin reductase-like flavin-dependent oxidoreductase (luciferase family)
MLEQCEWADGLGFDYVWLSEHHASDDGYMPSPLIAAAAIAARTTRMQLFVSALLLPLHDPIRIAEEIAVVDLISQGRLQVVLAGGYVPAEFELFGKERRQRPELLIAGIEAIKRALDGDVFEFQGRRVYVRPLPYRRPRPPLYLGGSSEAAARRAAGHADGYMGGRTDAYVDQCARMGIDGRNRGWEMDTPPAWMVHVTHDPERDWGLIAPFALHESHSYADWAKAGNAPIGAAFSGDEPALKASGRYLVMTPEQTIAWARDNRGRRHLRFHPVMGGLSPEHGWQSLRLFEREVLPTLRREGLAPP